MKLKLLYITTLLFAISICAQTNTCGTTVNETFDVAGALPSGWTEYNTSGRVSVEAGKMKFNHNASMPSVYHTFSPNSDNATFSFDVSASRNSVNCQINLMSSTGKYLSSIAVGIGTATIKYATAMAAGVPTTFISGTPAGTFPTNTVFTLAAKINFTTKKVDYYNNGVLVFADVPFLEDAVDVAKIDIQLLYMYSNSGQFYFDNISLLSGEENRLQLTSNITTADALVASATIGTIYNQYPQASKVAFQVAINNAKTVAANCDSSSSTIDISLKDLQTAQDIFASTKINNPVLKLYNGDNFTGDKHEVYCGYYNGGLGEYEDWAVSFTLEKGYMATFAQNINGLGVSKIYIAQDNAIQINLPADLQHSISFIRVSPWYPVGKKGSLGDVKWTTSDNYNTSWYYNWGLAPTTTSSAGQFVPMAWSKADSWTSLEKMQEIGQNMSFNNLLAFNEPDNSAQSNLTVAQALEAYPKLLASGLRLGAPGVENVEYSTTTHSFNDGAWITQFMDACVASGYRVDFIPAHDYVRRSKSAFIERFKGLHDRYNLPVWVTEYNYGNPGVGSPDLTVDQGYTNIKGLTEVLEAADFVERYNWYYFFGSSSGIGGITNGVLNITGQFYRDLSSASSYKQEVYTQGVPLSVDANSISSKVLLYPSIVTNGVLNVNYSDDIKSSNIEISLFNTTGKLVKKVSDLRTKIDVSKFSDGLYIVKIASDKGTITGKIIIK